MSSMKKLLESIDAIEESNKDIDMLIWALLHPANEYTHIDDKNTMRKAAAEIKILRDKIKDYEALYGPL